ncbi:MAG: hypothetical protein JRG94_17320 [Deltaproteobacteria bacterium]|nr:hypothetical protein [Deltaproteobacteria bacterium]
MKSVRIGSSVAMSMAVMTTCVFSSMAGAEGIDIGGKTAVTGNFSVTTVAPDDFSGTDIVTTIVYVGTSITRTTADARWEYGAALTVGIFNLDVDGPGVDESLTIATYTPSAQLRINTDLLGAEENFLVYAGVVAGVTFIDLDFYDDEVGAFGPKFGGEYYFSSHFAVQLEDVILFDTENGINNSLSFGVKVLF